MKGEKRMEEYGPNSYKSKEKPETTLPEKRVGKVISGAAKSKKKGKIQKLAGVFITEDVRNVKSYVFLEVIVPAIKKAISDVVTNGIDMIFYGEPGKSRRNSTAAKVSYGKYYNGDYEPSRRNLPKSGFNYDDIIFENRGDAESVLDAMNDIISQFEVVSVGDLYDLAGVSTDNFTVNKYGWTDIRGCKVKRIRDGYILELPRAMPIN